MAQLVGGARPPGLAPGPGTGSAPHFLRKGTSPHPSSGAMLAVVVGSCCPQGHAWESVFLPKPDSPGLGPWAWQPTPESPLSSRHTDMQSVFLENSACPGTAAAPREARGYPSPGLPSHTASAQPRKSLEPAAGLRPGARSAPWEGRPGVTLGTGVGDVVSEPEVPPFTQHGPSWFCWENSFTHCDQKHSLRPRGPAADFLLHPGGRWPVVGEPEPLLIGLSSWRHSHCSRGCAWGPASQTDAACPSGPSVSAGALAAAARSRGSELGREAGAGSAVLRSTVASPSAGQELARDAPSLPPRRALPAAFPGAAGPQWAGHLPAVAAGSPRECGMGQLTAKGRGARRAPAPAKANRKPSSFTDRA